MIIKLDGEGLCLPDIQIRDWVEDQLSQQNDLHVGQQLLIDAIRACLLKRPLEQRPEITWIFYGVEVHFDKYLRSSDAWGMKELQILDDILMTIAWPDGL